MCAILVDGIANGYRMVYAFFNANYVGLVVILFRRWSKKMSTLQQLLREIDAKQERISKQRSLDQTQIKNLKEYFKVSLTYASNASEDKTLTESETKVVLEDGVAIWGKPLKDHLDAIGHGRAFDWMWELAKGVEVSEEDVKKLHVLCFQPSEGERAGEYRRVNVVITGSQHTDRLPSYEEVPALMKEWAVSLPEKRMKFHFSYWDYEK